MPKKVYLFICSLALWTSSVAITAALASPKDLTPSLGVDIAYFVPLGDWKAHRYAPIDQLQGGLSLALEYEVHVFGGNFALFGSATRFDLSEWEDYARSQGDDVVASASMYGYGILFKPYLAKGGPHFLNVDLGLAYYSFDTQESYAGFTYHYSFLKKGPGVILGLEYKALVSSNMALTVSVKALHMLEGVRYADGLKHDIIGLPANVGIRYIF